MWENMRYENFCDSSALCIPLPLEFAVRLLIYFSVFDFAETNALLCFAPS